MDPFNRMLQVIDRDLVGAVVAMPCHIGTLRLRPFRAGNRYLLLKRAPPGGRGGA